MQARPAQRDAVVTSRADGLRRLYPEGMETILWGIVGILTLGTGVTALAAIVAMAGSKYRG